MLDGNTYTNTIKASQQSAEFNYRAIEIDFIVTSDNKLIAGHDWTTFNKQTGFADMGGNPTTFEDAKSRKYLGYDVAGADDIARFFEQHPHITLVTDKVDDYRLLDMYFSNMKDRVLVEAFSVSSYIELKRHGYVPMLSLGGSIRKLFHPRILLSGGVDWVAMGYHYMPQYKLWFMSNILGIKLALFTINDKALCETYNNYAELIYTDSLLHGLE
ncbi:MAG: hypothetical protein SNH28_02820 [Rikenellaceae bacterium]